MTQVWELRRLQAQVVRQASSDTSASGLLRDHDRDRPVFSGRPAWSASAKSGFASSGRMKAAYSARGRTWPKSPTETRWRPPLAWLFLAKPNERWTVFPGSIEHNNRKGNYGAVRPAAVDFVFEP